MKRPENIKMGHGIFRSKVAQRIFFLFTFCALIPISALAYFTYSHFTEQLYQQASRRLYHDTKATGMAVIERLLFLETDLKMVLDDLQKESSQSMAMIHHRFNGRLKQRFIGLALVNNDNIIIDSLGDIKKLPILNNQQEQHLDAGNTLVLHIYGKDGFVGIYIVRSYEKEITGKKRLYGEIDSRYLWGYMDYLSPSTDLIVLDSNDGLLFSSLPNAIVTDGLKAAVKSDSKHQNFSWKKNGESFLSSYWDIFIYPQFLTNWKLIIGQSKADILSSLNYFLRTFQLLFSLTFLGILFLSIRQIRKNLVPIELLQDATRRIAIKDFSNPVKIETHDEFTELGESFNQMAAELKNHFNIMSQINRIGIALSVEKDSRRLMEIIIEGAKGITHADGGILFLMTKDQQIEPSIVCINSLHFTMGANEGIVVPLYDETGVPNTSMVAAYAANNDMSVNISDIYAETDFDFSVDRDFDQKIGYRSQSFLSIPMKDHDDETIGVLQLINAQDKQTQQIIPFSDEDQKIADTIASQAAVALTKNQLIDDLKKLFDSLVKLLATAIDEKSPHTGAHCRRVPELTMMLAKSVHNIKEGPFKDITFSEEELYELNIASLLHDCGKVTSPAHIMDKATKLETIFDRIHLIETRFEIIKRDLKIGLLKEKINGLEDRHDINLVELKKDVKNALNQINEDLNFIRSCNSGESFMTEAQMSRLNRIADSYGWLNAEGEKESILSDDESHNLKVPTGTITEEERNALNYHVVATSKMLESLSYPKKLQNVPAIAASHHERMDGKGYPKGLAGDQIPLQGRILAIADIFESLTAKNRPYKKGKTTEEALEIMSGMKEEGRIDPDLFDVFINEEVYSYYTVLN